MPVQITVDATDAADRTFLTWTPVTGQAWVTGAAPGPVDITLRNSGTAGGGKLVFDMQLSDTGTAQLALRLPPDGSKVQFWVAGEFQQPSSAYGDAAIEAVDSQGQTIGRRELMVRIRKDAATLSAAERDRFLVALGTLNDAGQGPFQAFRESHVRQSIDEAHGYPGFPPWHRAYLLDLERSLQTIDPSVALPYWRFDVPRPRCSRQISSVCRRLTRRMAMSSSFPMAILWNSGRPTAPTR